MTVRQSLCGPCALRGTETPSPDGTSLCRRHAEREGALRAALRAAAKAAGGRLSEDEAARVRREFAGDGQARGWRSGGRVEPGQHRDRTGTDR